jgi:hypothetical protein
MATMELARVDASCATFYLVHTFLAMLTIALMVRSSGWHSYRTSTGSQGCYHAARSQPAVFVTYHK